MDKGWYDGIADGVRLQLRKRMAVARPELIDLVVVGEQSWWAAVGAT